MANHEVIASTLELTTKFHERFCRVEKDLTIPATSVNSDDFFVLESCTLANNSTDLLRFLGISESAKDCLQEKIIKTVRNLYKETGRKDNPEPFIQKIRAI